MTDRVEYRPCLPGHLAYIQVQDAQKDDQIIMLNSDYADVAVSHLALSAWRGNVCIGAAGVVPVYPHRAVAWALLSRHVGQDMVTVTKKIRDYIRTSPFERIEMTVSASHREGQKWARLLGMTLETPVPLRKHGPRGEDEYVYARVR